jgi:hypothetical protein
LKRSHLELGWKDTETPVHQIPLTAAQGLLQMSPTDENISSFQAFQAFVAKWYCYCSTKADKLMCKATN